jgi:hypothetical protein
MEIDFLYLLDCVKKRLCEETKSFSAYSFYDTGEEGYQKLRKPQEKERKSQKR